MKKNNYNYTRPNQTHQDLLSNQDIKDKLKDYKKITDISTIPIGTHIRYFIISDKVKKFRLGGFLDKIDPQKRYISLSNGTIKWSVQLASSILYQKLSEDELKNELKEELKKELLTETINQTGGEKQTINDLKNEVKILTKKIDELKNIENNYNSLIKEYNSLLKKNESLNNKIFKIEEEIKKNKKSIK
jgi:hypothetical protein